MKIKFLLAVAVGIGLAGAAQTQAQVSLIAKGKLTQSSAGFYADLSGLDYNLENGAPANLLGGLGSGALGSTSPRDSPYGADRIEVRWNKTRWRCTEDYSLPRILSADTSCSRCMAIACPQGG